MTASNEGMTDRTIGHRLRTVRKTTRLTQAEAGTAIDVARTTLVAIEQGKRRVRTHELQALAIRYGTSANAILRREAVHLDLVPQFRSVARGPDDGTEQAARLLTDLVSAEVELENALGVARHRNFPPARPLLPSDVRSQAEHDAHELRVWLGLGAGPVRDMVSVMELDLGFRVYVRPLGSRISGLFAHDAVVGACVLLNADHPAGRRAYTAARELGHFTSTRDEPNVLWRDESPHSREERYADHFARAFLTPGAPPWPSSTNERHGDLRRPIPALRRWHPCGKSRIRRVWSPLPSHERGRRMTDNTALEDS